MRLSDWVRREGLSVKRVAELSGVSRASVTNAMSGVAIQTFELAHRLVTLTGGEVTHEEIADPDGGVRRTIALEVVPWQRQRRDRSGAIDGTIEDEAHELLDRGPEARELG